MCVRVCVCACVYANSMVPLLATTCAEAFKAKLYMKPNWIALQCMRKETFYWVKAKNRIRKQWQIFFCCCYEGHLRAKTIYLGWVVARLNLYKGSLLIFIKVVNTNYVKYCSSEDVSMVGSVNILGMPDSCKLAYNQPLMGTENKDNEKPL